MPYQLKTENKVTSLRLWGYCSIAERKSAAQELCSLNTDSSKLKVLFDFSKMKCGLPAGQQIELGKYLSSKEKLRSARLAVVRDSQDHSNIIAEAIAYEGGVKVVNFEYDREARRWLHGVIR